MTDRTPLRNQFIVPAVFAVMWAAKMFYAPPPFPLGQYMQAGAVVMFIWLAGMKYLEYRDKYRAPRP